MNHVEIQIFNVNQQLINNLNFLPLLLKVSILIQKDLVDKKYKITHKNNQTIVKIWLNH